MKNIVIAGFLVGTLAAGAATLAAPGEPQYTGRPGDPTEARVSIQNTPLPVELHGTPTVTLGAATVVQARIVRQAWEYRVITLPAGQLAAGQQLLAAGLDGWEAIGVPVQNSDGISLLLKRPAR
jgi:hypothetical protein